MLDMRVISFECPVLAIRARSARWRRQSWHSSWNLRDQCIVNINGRSGLVPTMGGPAWCRRWRIACGVTVRVRAFRREQGSRDFSATRPPPDLASDSVASIEPPPIRETNCFSMLWRGTGYKRLPAPPHMMTEIIRV
jgi:hypothetical protein